MTENSDDSYSKMRMFKLIQYVYTYVATSYIFDKFVDRGKPCCYVFEQTLSDKTYSDWHIYNVRTQ